MYQIARRRSSDLLLRPPHAADALADIAAGKFVVVTDDADRENEGDLIMAADRMTEEAMAFMVSILTPTTHDVLPVVRRLSQCPTATVAHLRPPVVWDDQTQQAHSQHSAPFALERGVELHAVCSTHRTSLPDVSPGGGDQRLGVRRHAGR